MSSQRQTVTRDVLETIIEMGQPNRTAIEARLGLPRVSVYRALSRLRDVGAIERVGPCTNAQWRCPDPRRARVALRRTAKAGAPRSKLAPKPSRPALHPSWPAIPGAPYVTSLRACL